jgi:N-acetyl-beta-hexosaminidase
MCQVSAHVNRTFLKQIEINAVDEVALQYALFTFMQLCKIYARTNIPSLRILDYSDVKYRAVLFDFSQGYYFKYEYFLSVLQMLTFYKMNQVHFYVKFSSLPPENNKLQWYHSIK